MTEGKDQHDPPRGLVTLTPSLPGREGGRLRVGGHRDSGTMSFPGAASQLDAAHDREDSLAGGNP